MTFIPCTITYYDEDITTWLTHRPSVVRQWISSIKYIHRYRLRKLVVGLDIEWCPPHLSRDGQSPVAILQLCVGHRCLIFQILHADYIPSSLVRFLENARYTFVGVGIQEDARKLHKDYGLQVSRMVDLRGLAVARLGEGSWAQAGLKRLCARVLGKELEKLKRISFSRLVENDWNLKERNSKMKKLFAIAFAAALLCWFGVVRSEDKKGIGIMLGGVRDCRADQNGGEIPSLARFAVEEHNKKQNSLLEFGRVLKAREQVVAGMMYYLTLEAVDAGKKKIYEAKVWVKPWMNFKQLQEFKHAKNGLTLTSSDLGDNHADAGK